MADVASSFGTASSRRLFWVAVAALLLLHACLVWLTREPILSPDANDYGLYLMLSRALQQFSYRDLHLLGTPIEAQYPPVYPLILAATGALTGNSLAGAQAITILCSVLALWFLADLTRRLAGPVAALSLLVMLAPNTHLHDYAGRVLAEMPYLAFSAATLWVGTVLGSGRGRIVAVSALAIAAALTRSTGLALVCAVGLLWLVERRWRTAVGYGVAALATVGSWLVWTAVAPDKIVARSYVATLASPHAHSSWPVLMIRRAVRSLQVYPGNAISILEFPTIPGTVIDNAAALLALLGLSVAGLAWLWSKGQRLPTLYAVSYLVMLGSYPFENGRFLVPLLPVLLLAMVVALDALGRRRSPRWGMVACAGLALPLSLSSLSRLPNRLTTAETCRHIDLLTAPDCFTPTARAYLGAIRYASDSIPADAAVLTTKEAVFSLHTGRMTFHPDRVRGSSAEAVMHDLRERGVGYILLSDYPDGSNIGPRIGAECRFLDLVFAAAPITYLLRIRPPESLAVDSAACEAVDSSVRLSRQRRGHEAWVPPAVP